MITAARILFLCISLLMAGSELTVVQTIPTKAKNISTDPLGNYYLISDNEVIKYDPQGKFFSKFSSKTTGKISFFDATNPMKVLVYYRDFSKILFLDNMLAPSGNTLLLESIGMEQAILACSSHQNGFWLYNQQSFELIRLNQELEITNRTGNLAQLLGIELAPDHLFQHNNRVYLNNPSTGLLEFDVFGTYSRNIPKKNLQNIQFYGDLLLYREGDTLKSFHLKTLDSAAVTLPAPGCIKACMEKNRYFLLYPGELRIARPTL